MKESKSNKSLEKRTRKLRSTIVKILLSWEGYESTTNVVLHEYKAIYFPIPKAATKSIKSYFKNLLDVKSGYSFISSGSIHEVKFPSVDTDKIANEYENYFKFCIVRNPWQRVVSSYLNKVYNPKNNINVPKYKKWLYDIYPNFAISDHHQIPFFKYPVLHQKMSFEEYVYAISVTPDDKIDKHLRSQHKFITDKKGNLLVDYIGYLENLEHDFEVIAKNVGLPNKRLPHVKRGEKDLSQKQQTKNTHSKDSYSDFYTEETWEIIRARYEEDIKMFGYDSTYPKLKGTV